MLRSFLVAVWLFAVAASPATDEVRRLLAAATEIARRAYEGQESAEELIDQAEQLIFSIAQDRRRQSYAAIRDILVDTFEHIERLYLHQGETIGVPTGFRDLDNMLSGLHPSELVILAARPSQGKTTLAMNIGTKASTRRRSVRSTRALRSSTVK